MPQRVRPVVDPVVVAGLVGGLFATTARASSSAASVAALHAYDTPDQFSVCRVGGASAAEALPITMSVTGTVDKPPPRLRDFNITGVGGRHLRQSFSLVSPNTTGRIPWTSFDDYPQVTIGGRRYADVGGRPYTQHEVDRMQPSGPGRSISPNYVEDVLTSDLMVAKPVTGPLGTSHVNGSVEVITEGDIVITIISR